MEDHMYPKIMAGFVYLMRDHRGRYKIGHSVNPRHRRRQLSSLTRPVSLDYLIETDNMIAIELELHMRFKVKRVSIDHEWYRLTKDDVQIIVREYGAQRYVPNANPNVP